jgi:hypothetical protein
MNLTVNNPGTMTVLPEHVADDQTMVYVDADETRRALTLWIDPATAAQWIKALTPIAEAQS